MILRGQLRGKVGRRRDIFSEKPLSNQRLFAFLGRAHTIARMRANVMRVAGIVLLAAFLPQVARAHRADPIYVAGLESIYSFDFTTGAATPVLALPLSCRIFVAYDDSRREILCITGQHANQRLVALNITSNDATTVPIQWNENLYSAQYDPLTDEVFALTNASGRPLVRIQRDGTVSTIATGAQNTVAFAPSTYDVAGHRYFFAESNYPNQNVITVHTSPFASIETITFPSEVGFNMLEYDPATAHLLVGKWSGGTDVFYLDPVTGARTMIGRTDGHLLGQWAHLDVSKRILYVHTSPPDGFYLGAIDLLDGATILVPTNVIGPLFQAPALTAPVHIPALTITGSIVAAIALALCAWAVMRGSG
jgi:hypothetical protein